MTGHWSLAESGVITLDGEIQTAQAVNELDAKEKDHVRSSLGLRFSKLALDMALEISGSFPEGLQVQVGVVKNNNFHVCPVEVDHQVIGIAWHAVDPISRSHVVDLLERHGVSEGQITPGRYHSLAADIGSSSIIRVAIEDTSETDRAAILPSLPLPDGLEANLYPYQRDGSTFLRRLARLGVGCLLGDEMGLGKTLQVITLILDLAPASRTLVVAPASLLTNWHSELAKFAPRVRTLIHAGPHRTGVAGGFDGFDVVITSYETVLRDLVFMKDIEWEVAVLDEAQQIRNPDARRSEAVKQLRRRVSVAVTGTPVENRLQDLWSIAEFLLPPLLGSRPAFDDMFPDEQEAAYRLGRIVSPITIRRRVADVAADLPEKTEFVTPVEFAVEDRERYDAIKPAFENHTERLVLCAHAQAEDDLRPPDFAQRPKVKHLLSLLDEIFETGEKALVFSSFRRTADRIVLETAARHKAAFVAAIDGRTEALRRKELIDALASSDGPGCLVLNPKAAGVGLNIVSANHVIHFDPNYNPAVARQATARAWRRGQELPVFVHHLFYTDTVEEDAHIIQAVKQGLADQLDEGVEKPDEHGRS